MSSNAYTHHVPLIENIIKEYQSTHLLNADLLITHDMHVLYRKKIGWQNLDAKLPFSDDTLFRIASLTKQFTAVAILLLCEEGKLDLHDQKKEKKGHPLFS